MCGCEIAPFHCILYEPFIDDGMPAWCGIGDAHIPGACPLPFQIHIEGAKRVQVNFVIVEGHAPFRILPCQFQSFLCILDQGERDPELSQVRGYFAGSIYQTFKTTTDIVEIRGRAFLVFIDEFHIPNLVAWLDFSSWKLTCSYQNGKQDHPADTREFFHFLLQIVVDDLLEDGSMFHQAKGLALVTPFDIIVQNIKTNYNQQYSNFEEDIFHLRCVLAQRIFCSPRVWHKLKNLAEV
jgi:hypothetical protein